jgi:hypothetical protein
MKRISNPIAIFFLSLISLSLSAQNAGDVERYTSLLPGGTARSIGVGGALGALGADFSTLSYNPAGLAMYRADEFTFTPSIKFGSSKTALPNGAATRDDKSNFGFDNIGVVFNTTPRGGKWRTFNVGIGMNRLANYNNAYYYTGDAAGSIMNTFFADAKATFAAGGNQDDLDAFGSGLAWDANAIYQDALGTLSYDFSENPSANVSREQVVNTSGRMNEMAISFAGNLEDKLMVGATIGVPFVKYRQDSDYQESDQSGAVPFFDALNYNDFFSTEGVGVNLKLGVGYWVSQAFRLGAAVHSPTYLRLTDRYSTSFSYDYTDGSGSNTSGAILSPDGTSDYRLRTPWRAIGSAALVMGKLGFIDADIEFVDYSNNRYNFTADVASTDNKELERILNNEIQRAYKQTTNVRVGAEIAQKKLRLRGGLNLLGKPEQDQSGFNMAYSAGIGVRSQSFFLDLGWRHLSGGKGSIQPYTDAPVATTSSSGNDWLLTLGFRF